MSYFPAMTAVLGQGPYASYFRSFGTPNPFAHTWFVDSVNGSNANAGNTSDLPFATLAQALLVAAANDTIFLAPGFAVTLTAVVSLTLAGLSIIGLGAGSLKPTITVNAAADGLSLDAANITIDNIAFAAPGTDEATSMINVTKAGCTLRNISGIGSTTAKNFVDCITVATGADDLTIDKVDLYNSVVAVNSFLSIEAAVNRLKVTNFFAFGDVVAGGIIDAAKALQIHFFNVVVAVVGTTKPAITLDSNPTGLIENCKFSGTDATLANNGNTGNLVRSFNVWLLEEIDNSKQGVQIPAVDVD